MKETFLAPKMCIYCDNDTRIYILRQERLKVQHFIAEFQNPMITTALSRLLDAGYF